MKIAAYQGPVVFGDAEANLQATLDSLESAEAAGASVLCMPETFLHGYFPTQEQALANSVELAGDEFAALLERVRGYSPTLILGLNELRGDKLYNTAVVIERGKLLGRYSKNYLVYEYFERGHEFPVFERDGVTFGVIICADSSFMEPARIETMRGAQILFSPHFNYIGYDGVEDHTWRVRQHHIALAVKNDVYVVRANVTVPESVGEPIFGRKGVGVGDSFILNRCGRVLVAAGLFTHTLLVCEVPEADLASGQRPFHRVDAEIARQLAEEYAKVV
ncbi:MAG: carbon-nitrogen hydrolase family protein [Armatimonadetes bacterium CG_4_10_14_3_um_filter_66_18]|nr:carbon-nitrogen hydrolase family protein [Armatimonadota bacterium]OIO97114.1 MAG: hypothetical protein AUJ96_23800 [Armatimonadetes bacterium CG2_30_66_41]PIU91542.1 MAG: carbon-nitrogen hydrolase family protein [Armatimonadetes bacterium CG06_land_8_20_14_3_00_66_21]PIX36926.1 MAG: carbon-nitrogen hydrolase family protein [Armatimonadetes bacterium CG_4_8_14_3_um_filter_66_20]PIY50875.1 MAG: carbon-nitrogen hydrolase family protein [Armatimonadetes bacterium CG_4_10_14_3_um_filter_66_18]P